VVSSVILLAAPGGGVKNCWSNHQDRAMRGGPTLLLAAIAGLAGAEAAATQ
jgi:hypothetical protein